MATQLERQFEIAMEGLRCSGSALAPTQEAETRHAAGIDSRPLRQHDEEVTRGASEQLANRANARARPSEGEEEREIAAGDDDDDCHDDDDRSDANYELHGGKIRSKATDVDVEVSGGYPFHKPPANQATSPEPIVFPAARGINDIGPSAPPVQNSPGHRSGFASGVDQICAYTNTRR